MSRRASINLDHAGNATPTTTVHHIVIETRHLPDPSSGAAADQSPPPSSPPLSPSQDRRLSIAALQLVDELEQQQQQQQQQQHPQQHHQSPPASRRSSVSHHIIVETTQHPSSARSSMIINAPGMTDYTTYAPPPMPRSELGGSMLSSRLSGTLNNRSSMPPDTVVEESEFDIMSYEKGKARAAAGFDDDDVCMQDSCPYHHHHRRSHSATSSYSTRSPSPGPTNLADTDDTKGGGSKNSSGGSRQCIPQVRAAAWAYFVKYWFLLGLGLVIGLAWRFPEVGKTNGAIQAQYSVKWGCVILIFLLSGLGIDVRVMFKTILHWRLHLVVQAINFLAMPFMMYGIVLIFVTAGASLNASVYKGWMIALSTSTTVSSNVVMTRNAKGNDSAALFNAALGNVMGIFACPALMSVFQRDPRVFPPGTPAGNPDYLHVLKNLGFTVLLPLVVGQLLRFYFPDPIKKLAAKMRFPIINNLALLCLVWSVFCDGVASHAFDQMSAVDIVAMIFVDILMYLFGCALCLLVARAPWPTASEPRWIARWRFSRQDSVAIMYCGATKTVSMGIPLINVLYASSSYGVVGVLSLPLLMYHVMQLFLGNLQVQMLKNWIQKHQQQLPDHHSANEKQKHHAMAAAPPAADGSVKHQLPQPALPVFVPSSPGHLRKHWQSPPLSHLSGNEATSSSATIYSGTNQQQRSQHG